VSGPDETPVNVHEALSNLSYFGGKFDVRRVTRQKLTHIF